MLPHYLKVCFSYTNNHKEFWLKKSQTNYRDAETLHNNKFKTFLSRSSQSNFHFNSIHFNLNSLLSAYVWFTEIGHILTAIESTIHTRFFNWHKYCAKSRQNHSWHHWNGLNEVYPNKRSIIFSRQARQFVYIMK